MAIGTATHVAENIVRELAGRIGPIPEGGEVPAIVRRQRWSPINVPLMWAAAGGEPSTPVLQWLVQCFSDVAQVHFHEGFMNAQEAVRTGWRALRGVFRLWGIEEREDLTVWLRGQGFAGTRPGNHIAARAQKFILSEACRVDARVALLEICGSSSPHWTHDRGSKR